jgi:hypothetical protein
MNGHPWARRVRMRLRRADGRVFIERWGAEIERLGGIFVHRMSAPDPGVDLHDHPWWFVTVPLVGSYTEQRAPIREAPAWARVAEKFPETVTQGVVQRLYRWRPRLMRLTECHRITDLHTPVVWTLVVHGPNRRRWGFYLPDGWMDEHTYAREVRSQRRDMWDEHDTAGSRDLWAKPEAQSQP